MNRRESREARAHLAVGTGRNALLSFDEPFDAVEIDAYRIDCHSTVLFFTPEGGVTNLFIKRLWLVAAVEVSSSAVLSYTIVYRSEVIDYMERSDVWSTYRWSGHTCDD